jgi:hypothetical protein
MAQAWCLTTDRTVPSATDRNSPALAFEGILAGVATSRVRPSPDRRAALRAEADPVRALEQRLVTESFPRLHMALIVAVAGLGAFLTSALLLYAGVTDMAIRYFIAAIAGYATFIGLVSVWLAYQRRQWSLHDGVGEPGWDGPSDPIGSPACGSRDPTSLGEGDAFGGGGASGSFEPWSGTDTVRNAGDSSLDLDASPADVDDAGLIVMAIAVVTAGVLALGFVVYMSPLLFAEALLDAAVVGAVYRRARQREKMHWTRGVLRRTWLPAAGIALCAALLGFALHAVKPEARSLGDVLASAEGGRTR